MSAVALDPALVVPCLRATPGLLRAMAADAGARAWTPPAPGEWSIAEVVRHLVHGDRDTFLPRLRRMLAEDRPVFDTRGPRDDDPRDLALLLDRFAAARADVLALLAGLDGPGWRREGVSPSRGPVTVEAYARTMAEHDREHLRQIQDVRGALGLLPKRGEAHVALGRAELAAALGATPNRLAAAGAGRAWPRAPRPASGASTR